MNATKLISRTNMVYDQYQYLWPPRPDVASPPDMINWYETNGYVGQKKKNGACTLVFCHGKEVVFKGRHGPEDDPSQWSPLPAHLEFFGGIGKGWNVFVAELIHAKVRGIRNELYIFDQLVHNSRLLYGKTFLERQQLLTARFRVDYDGDAGTVDRFRVHEHVTIARTFTSGFKQVFADLAPEDEGLVFKRPTAKLKPCNRAASNEDWQAKVRRPKKNYSF